MNGICGINVIAPRWGLRREAITFRRATPYANDFGLSAHIIVEDNQRKSVKSTLSACKKKIIPENQYICK
jgi:hypothetical protein